MKGVFKIIVIVILSAAVAGVFLYMANRIKECESKPCSCEEHEAGGGREVIDRVRERELMRQQLEELQKIREAIREE